MRDIKRIYPFLKKLGELWALYPDLRFGQLIYMLAEDMKYDDIFYPEESVWEETIKARINRMNSKF